jgi:hypothetical protein
MNAPNFNFDNVPIHPTETGSGFLSAALTEQKRVCGTIDQRISELEDEFIAMVDEMKALTASLDTTRGFFKRWSIHTKMYNLGGKISINRDMRYELVCARISRTYA